MLKFGEFGWRVPRSSLYNFWNFSVGLKLLQNDTLSKTGEFSSLKINAF